MLVDVIPRYQLSPKILLNIMIIKVQVNVNKFDGTNEEPRTCLLLFQKACENNDWLNEELRISNRKSAFVPGSAADKWHSSRLLDDKLEGESD